MFPIEAAWGADRAVARDRDLTLHPGLLTVAPLGLNSDHPGIHHELFPFLLTTYYPLPTNHSPIGTGSKGSEGSCSSRFRRVCSADHLRLALKVDGPRSGPYENGRISIFQVPKSGKARTIPMERSIVSAGLGSIFPGHDSRVTAGWQERTQNRVGKGSKIDRKGSKIDTKWSKIRSNGS